MHTGINSTKHNFFTKNLFRVDLNKIINAHLVVKMSLKIILSCFLILMAVTLNAEDVFYNSCDESKTTMAFIKTTSECDAGFCEMKSLCKTNKGEMYVSHLCPSKKNGKCPTMIDCLDDNSISTREYSKPQNTSHDNMNSSESGGVSK